MQPQVGTWGAPSLLPPVPTHLPLGLIENSVHGVEQGHAPVELQHLLLGQLQAEADTRGKLGTRGKGPGPGGLGRGSSLTHLGIFTGVDDLALAVHDTVDGYAGDDIGLDELKLVYKLCRGPWELGLVVQGWELLLLLPAGVLGRRGKERFIWSSCGFSWLNLGG